MMVYVLHRYYDTPDVDGNEVMGVYSELSRAQSDMHTDVSKIKAHFSDGFWDDDMTWEEEREVHLGRDQMDGGQATVYCWEIKEMEVQ